MNSQKPNNSRLKRPALYITILIGYLAISLIISSITLVLSINHYNNVRELSAGFEGLLLIMGMIVAAPPSLYGIFGMLFKKKSAIFTAAIALIPLGIMTSLSYDLNYYSMGYVPPLNELTSSIVQLIGAFTALSMIYIMILAYFSSYWNSSKNSMSKK